MELQVQLDKHDFRAMVTDLQDRASERAPKISKLRGYGGLAVWAGLVFGVLVFLEFDGRETDWPTAILLSAAIIIGYLIWCVMATEGAEEKFDPDPDGLFCQPFLLSFDEDGVRSESTDSNGFVSWRCFQEIREDESRYFLYVDKGDALVIPKSTFTSPKEREAWYKSCERMIGGKSIW